MKSIFTILMFLIFSLKGYAAVLHGCSNQLIGQSMILYSGQDYFYIHVENKSSPTLEKLAKAFRIKVIDTITDVDIKIHKRDLPQARCNTALGRYMTYLISCQNDLEYPRSGTIIFTEPSGHSTTLELAGVSLDSEVHKIEQLGPEIANEITLVKNRFYFQEAEESLQVTYDLKSKKCQ